MQNKTIAFPITPKGVMNEIHHHIFYQYVTSDDVIFLDLWSGRPQGIAPTNKIPSDVYCDNYEFCIDHGTHVRASLRGQCHISSDKSHQMYFTTIMHSALTMTRTSALIMNTHVRASLRGAMLYFIGQIPSDVFHNNYAL